MGTSRTRRIRSHRSGGSGHSRTFPSLWTIRVLAWGLALAGPLASSRTASSRQSAKATNPDKAAVQSVDSVGMTVSDIDRSIAFYSQVLSFAKVSDLEL